MDGAKSVKETLRMEKESMKSLSFGEKLVYLWDYHRVHIFFAVLAVALIIFCVYRAFFMPEQRMTILFAADTDVSTTTLSEWVDDFAEYAGIDQKRETVTVTKNFGGDITSEDAILYMYTMLAVDEMDCILCCEDVLEYIAGLGCATPVDSIWEEAEVQPFSDRLVWCDVKAAESGAEADSYEGWLAVDLTGTAVYTAALMEEAPLYLVVPVNSHNYDDVLQLLWFLTEEAE